MSLSVTDLISLVVSIHHVCGEGGTSKKVLQVAGEKLMTTKPLLEELENRKEGANNMEHMIKMLSQHLERLSKIVNNAKKMKTILYIVKALSIHADLEVEMGHIQFTLGAVSVHQNHRVKDQLQNFLTQWQKQEDRLIALREQEKQERINLVEGDIQANLLKFTGSSKQELETVVEALRAEAEELRRKAEMSKDESLQTRFAQEEVYIQNVIESVELAEEEKQQQDPSNRSEVQEWAYCPISKEIMTDPVTLDCMQCQKAFSRSAAKEWLSRGNTSCPCCHSQLRSSDVSPSPHLRQAIDEFMSYTLPGAPIEDAEDEAEVSPCPLSISGAMKCLLGLLGKKTETPDDVVPSPATKSPHDSITAREPSSSRWELPL